MQTVKFRTNLGRIDAHKLGIENPQDCLRGATVEVSDRAAEVLEKRNIAHPTKVKAIAKEPAIGQAK